MFFDKWFFCHLMKCVQNLIFLLLYGDAKPRQWQVALFTYHLCSYVKREKAGFKPSPYV